MVIIGLCGSSGSGKGYVCTRFAEHGVAYIDTDLVYRESVLTDKNCIGELVSYFGDGILENGSVSKSRLASIVFEGEGSLVRLKKLNEITHKFIKVKTLELVSLYEGRGYGAVLIDAPVLFESGFDSMCHVTVCVTAPNEIKLERIVKRDNISFEKAAARLNSQLSDCELRKRCTYEIDNSGKIPLDSQIYDILKDLKIEK